MIGVCSCSRVAGEANVARLEELHGAELGRGAGRSTWPPMTGSFLACHICMIEAGAPLANETSGMVLPVEWLAGEKATAPNERRTDILKCVGSLAKRARTGRREDGDFSCAQLLPRNLRETKWERRGDKMDLRLEKTACLRAHHASVSKVSHTRPIVSLPVGRAAQPAAAARQRAT